jgi:hypothetical protein
VVRGAASVLTDPGRPRTAALRLAIALAVLLAWDHLAEHLPDTSKWPATIVIVLIAMPLALAPAIGTVDLVRPRPRLAAAFAVAGALLAILFTRTDLVFEASAAKVVAGSAAGALAAAAIASPLEVAALAVVVIGVDAYSVFAGPTKVIIAHHPDVLDAFTIEMPGPGGHSAALGVTDVFFFGLLLSAVLAYGLRARPSALLMVASFGVTYVLAVALDRALPALPLLSIAFLGVNADLLLARARVRR